MELPWCQLTFHWWCDCCNRPEVLQCLPMFEVARLWRWLRWETPSHWLMKLNWKLSFKYSTFWEFPFKNYFQFKNCHNSYWLPWKYFSYLTTSVTSSKVSQNNRKFLASSSPWIVKEFPFLKQKFNVHWLAKVVIDPLKVKTVIQQY